jgi:Cu(I)/Ag(I) efflux system membrane fusion protein
MKTLRLIAVFSTVAVGAVLLVQGDDDVPKNQTKTNQIIIAPPTPDHSLKDPVKSVLDHYLKIQAALADDSTKSVSANALAISKAVKADDTKTLSSDVADAADALAKAKDLPEERESFKDLSQSLIKYLSDKKVRTGRFEEIFCPMANAYWLQTNQDIANPYLGHSMLECGETKRAF